MNPPLVLTDICKSYGSGQAVSGASFEVRPGEVFGLLGLNGAGKSTTLRIISGLVRPDRGTVRIGGHDVFSDRASALRTAGFLIEGPALPADLSARETLEYLALLSRCQAGPRLDELLEWVGLHSAGRKPVRQFSLGMKQRLGIAAALVADPALVVLDEPLNGLDPAGIREINALIRRLADRGKAVLLSSHLLDEVERIADRVCVMHLGKVVATQSVQAGTLSALFFSTTAGGPA